MIEKEISITFMSGPMDGQALMFEQPDIGEELVINIGRREGCDVYLPFDNQVSRLHSRLIISSMAVTATESVTEPYLLTFYLEDAGSRNGTFVERDKQPIRGRVALRPGSFFRIGRTWMRLDVPLSM
ncbi:MAG: FHA domain-containing protein [Anaerolineae bacterium]|nr:FHA domain-containing protein [Anaerolineae bacterium]